MLVARLRFLGFLQGYCDELKLELASLQTLWAFFTGPLGGQGQGDSEGVRRS